MRVIFLIFDSLNRRALGCYGGTTVRTPNFDRFARRAVTFDNHYAGSLPCMPARRDMHTGRLNFLHRSWGPLEPFDNSFPALLRERGVYSHLVSDHYHYFADGGWGYHQRYTTWEFIRGQEADPWQAMVRPPLERFRERYHPQQVEEQRGGLRLQNLINREAIVAEEDYPCVRCFAQGLAFLDCNRDADDWFLQIETFDPHEPFHAPERLRREYPTGYGGPILDWPRYRPVEETPAEIAELQANYAALVTLCDEQFGRLLDYLDAHRLWDDTVVVATTDHGFLLNEHEWWGKNRMPCYNEIVHLPLLIHHPAWQHLAGQRRSALTQTIDLMPTFLDLFGAGVPPEVRGHSLLPVLQTDHGGHAAVIYGLFGGATNVTDGRHTYFRYPPDPSRDVLHEYTLLPVHANGPFAQAEFAGAVLTEGFPFTRGYPALRLPALPDARRPPLQGGGFADARSALYDLRADPDQTSPSEDSEATDRLLRHMTRIMREHDAPREAFARLGLEPL